MRKVIFAVLLSISISYPKHHYDVKFSCASIRISIYMVIITFIIVDKL